jgi:predicted O-methyltransferase YrrM
MTMQEALEKVGRDLGLSSVLLTRFAAEDDIGGYTLPENAQWPGGCIWGAEGQFYYALTRLLRPTVVVEVGTNFGCSTAHWVAAMDKNGAGKLYCLDVSFANLRTHSSRMEMLLGDGIESSRTLIAEGVVPDILYEDGPHTREFTRDFIKLWLPVMRKDAIVIVHDIEFAPVQPAVQDGFRDAVGAFDIFRVPPSICGAGYWGKP